jgi:hypothetical protein
MNKINVSLGIAIVMILAAVSTRFLPHPPNFTAIGAMALFGGAYFSKQSWAIAIPFVALFLSDLVLNYFVYHIDFSVYSLCSYSAFGLVYFAGSKLLSKVNAKNILLASICSSMIFFLITNAFSWQLDPMYSKDFTGLMSSYALGLPFFWNTLAGDLFYSAVLFGIYVAVTERKNIFVFN